MNITLEPMTNDLAHLFYNKFTYDPATFAESMPDKPYQYIPEKVNAYCEKQRDLHRIHLAILKENQPIGEILFKNVDHTAHSCVFSIHLQNDAVKNQGIGTEAARKALAYASEILEMKTIFADALIQNTRSRHVLTKVGYQEIGRDELFCYYSYEFSQHSAVNAI